jgi:hypothetical protein
MLWISEMLLKLIMIKKVDQWNLTKLVRNKYWISEILLNEPGLESGLVKYY